MEDIDMFFVKKNLDYALEVINQILDKHATKVKPDSSDKTTDLIHTARDKINRIDMHIERKDKKIKMVTSGGTPSAGYKFNSFEEIKSHSSILYNERQAILFYLLDMRSIDMNTSSNISDMLTTRAILKQIYKNIRMLLRYNPVVRSTLDLETQDKGIYVPDVAIGMIDKMIEFCEKHGWTQKKIYIVIQELNNLEMLIKDILQYFHYFIRPDFKQKPDIEIATLKYKQIADDRTIEELKERGGDCKNWAELYIDYAEDLGFNVEMPIVNTGNKTAHTFAVISDETGYCKLDQMSLDCFEFDN